MEMPDLALQRACTLSWRYALVSRTKLPAGRVQQLLPSLLQWLGKLRAESSIAWAPMVFWLADLLGGTAWQDASFASELEQVHGCSSYSRSPAVVTSKTPLLNVAVMQLRFAQMLAKASAYTLMRCDSHSEGGEMLVQGSCPPLGMALVLCSSSLAMQLQLGVAACRLDPRARAGIPSRL